jgi:midasin
MNDSFKRMAALTIKAINNREPVLLVGETGCGKTTLA